MQKFTYVPSRYIHMPKDEMPKILYCEGDVSLLNEPIVGFCGAHEGPKSAEETTFNIAAMLASHGYTIISGGCRHIDAAAHRGALSVKGRTIAVLPHSLNRGEFYEQHTALFDDIRENGLLISEYAQGKVYGPTVFPHYYQKRFLERNRLITGFGLVTIAVHWAHPNSGTANTVRTSKIYGKEVWVPLLRSDARQHSKAHESEQYILRNKSTSNFIGFGKNQMPAMLKHLEILARQ